MPKDHPPGSHDPKLDARLCELEEMFVRFAKAGATDNILGGGFGSMSDHLETVSRHLESISAQMAPLRTLTQEPPLEPAEQERLDYLIAALAPPRWNGLTSLSFDTQPVNYIGQVVPDDDHCDPNQVVHYRSAAS
jgi:hypothetical protein